MNSAGGYDGAGLHIDRLTGRDSLLRSTDMEGLNAATIKPETRAAVRAHQSDCAQPRRERGARDRDCRADGKQGTSQVGESRTANKTSTSDVSARPSRRPAIALGAWLAVPRSSSTPRQENAVSRAAPP
jgi:hypothetical protein